MTWSFLFRFTGFLLSTAALWVPALAHPSLPESRDPSETLAVLSAEPEDQIDLAWSKLVLDALVDPDVNVKLGLLQIDALAGAAEQLAGPGADDMRKVAALRTLIYKPGAWNGDAPFDYDFDNPNGRNATDKTLAQYLETRRGNCVNMPILFLAVAARMGLEMNITTAPRHVFLQFEDTASGEVQHLEATSGAWPQRIVWQRKVLQMTDRAIESGMYMQRLTPRQQVAVMGEILLHQLQEDGDQRERAEVAEVILDVFPEFDIALLHLQDAYSQLISSEFEAKYPSIAAIPEVERPRFEAWAAAHYGARHDLDELGWQPAIQTSEVVLPGEGKPE